MELKLKFALVGTGNIAKQHLTALLECGQELVAVCNRNADKAVNFLNEFSHRENVCKAELNSTVFDNVAEMLEKVDIDVLYITTPHPTHVDVACLAVRKGIHCIIEKPLDISLAKASYLLEESKRTGALVSVIAQSRYFACAERIKNAIDDGKIGDVAMAQVQVLGWRDENYYRSNTWRGTWEHEGGGVLVNQSVHELDLLCYFLGEVKSVYGVWKNVNHPYIEVEDSAQAIVCFQSGATASIMVSNSVNPAQSSFVHVIGSSGHTLGIKTHEGVEENAGLAPMTFRAHNDIFTLVDNACLKEYTNRDKAEFTDEQLPYYHFMCQIKELVHAIEVRDIGIKERLRSNIQSAMGCMQIFKGIYLSQELGRKVTVKEIMDRSNDDLTNPNGAVNCKAQE